MIPEEELIRRVKQGRLLALLFLVLVPVLYLIIAFLSKPDRFSPDDSHRFMLYVILIVAFICPPGSIIVKKFQSSNFQQNRGKVMKQEMFGFKKREVKMTPGQFYINSLIVQLAFVEAVFVYGLIIYFVSADIVNMLYFYIIGIIWSVIFWPREEKARTFMKSFEEI